MLNAFNDPLCSELCWHNRQVLTYIATYNFCLYSHLVPIVANAFHTFTAILERNSYNPLDTKLLLLCSRLKYTI